MRELKQRVGFLALRLAILVTCLALFLLVLFIAVRGLGVVNLKFLTDFPREGMTKGGIFPAILGTIYLSLGSIAFALPLGVLGAIYLAEYARGGKWVQVVRVGINTLSGVPSVVFGLFGLAVFVKLVGFGVSLLSGALTLGILILPIVIRATEEAINGVPQDFREASLALGATKWQTVRGVVLPTALPGILTGTILGIGRAAGETAPILFTAATLYTRFLPGSVFDEVMALPYHIYGLMTEGIQPQYQIPIAYGTALVLLLLVLGVNLVAIIIRYRSRKAKKW